MERLGNFHVDSQGAITLASAVTALPFPTTNASTLVGMVEGFADEERWLLAEDGQGKKGVSRGELVVYGAGAVDLTSAVLYGLSPQPITLADDDVDTVDFANNELDINSHVYLTGDGPVQLTTTDTLPAGLELATDYYISYIGANTVSLATSRANAFAGTYVAFTDGGTGTHTVEDTADTERVHYLHHGQLGPANDGAITLTAQQGYRERFYHSPQTIGYCVTATLSTTVATTIKVYPAHEFRF